MANPNRPNDNISVPVRMPAALDQLITSTAEEIKLSKQDTIRLSIERGVQILKRQLTGDPVAAA
jgi:hypothetical protein